jgi:hypothetical protein
MFSAEPFVHFPFISIGMFFYVISEKFLGKLTWMFFLSLKNNILKVPKATNDISTHIPPKYWNNIID